ncbi:MAG: OmpA family protein [Acidobacteria bacterium]|nr:OmpA family protein [Acidobacteriota bacterium]
MLRRFPLFAAALLLSTSASFAQAPPPSDVEILEETPLFVVETVAGTTEAVDYRFRRGSTKIAFQGTSLLPGLQGEATVKSNRGVTEVSARFQGLEPATQFGAEYLTYVLWGISPEGRALNLGEVYPDDDGDFKLDVTTELQAFAMIVTAEPYFTVRRPSNVIVAENQVLPETRGGKEPLRTKFELLERGQYEKLSNPLGMTVDTRRVPLDLYQARNAVQVARALNAETLAPDTFAKAVASLEEAEQRLKDKEKAKDIADRARRAVQIAEDSRELAVKRADEMRREAERRAAAERETQAKEAAERAAQDAADARQRQQEEAALRAQAQQAATAAERQKLEAELAASKAREQMQAALREKEAAQRVIDQARAEAEQAKLERQRLEEATMESQRAVEQARAEKIEALRMIEQAKTEADEARRQAARLEELRASAEAQAAQAIAERDAMEQRMQGALSKIVETRESARGLILNLPDILFDFGKSTLRPEARETLARIAGVMMVTPGYNLWIEGHTDSVGSDEANLKLSEARADSVKAFLGKSDIDPQTITTVGLGETQPVASNDTDAGRQKNRRVEIIIQESSEQQ